jgi:putative ubiquitin-RnfH superfamily antitoxin RatB of RatAB toxin-antitoxin module
MAMNNYITVEVAYVSKDQCLLTVKVPASSTILDVIMHSGILQSFPDINLETQAVGIFGKVHALTDKVNSGDRIELYRPLTIDPKEARRKRAIKNTRALKNGGRS